MEKKLKNEVILELKDKLAASQYFYVCDSSTLSVDAINKFRRLCFNAGIEYRIAKNTLIRKALEQIEGGKYDELYPVLHGPTGLMFSTDGSAAAKVIKEFRKDKQKPALKGAYIDTDVYIGDSQLDVLAKLKTKTELLGEIIGMLQSPAQNVISGLQGNAGQKVAGLVKALEERAA